jgi:DNA polymerase V
MGRGGARKGAGRPQKAEKTLPLRIPERMKTAVLSFIASNGNKIPLYSSRVAAGALTSAEDHIEANLDLTELLVRNPANTFLVRALGESMLNAGIQSNDILIVDKSIEPTSGKIVIAAVDGQLTVKRLHKTKNTLYLMPENEAFDPIRVTPENDIYILGVVTNIIHTI